MSSITDAEEQVSGCSAKWTDLFAWQQFGLCQQDHLKKYYNEESKAQVKWAKRICLGCPVRAQCLQWGLERAEICGIWGGLSSRERRAVAAIAHDGTWREEVARRPWCPWCGGRDVTSPHTRRLRCNGCFFEWPGLLPVDEEKELPVS